MSHSCSLHFRALFSSIHATLESGTVTNCTMDEHHRIDVDAFLKQIEAKVIEAASLNENYSVPKAERDARVKQLVTDVHKQV